MLQDFRYALRQCRRSPGFFTVAALLIAIGIAANTQIFTFVNVLLLRPLPVRAPQSLVQIFETRPKLPLQPYWDYGFYRRLSNNSTSLSQVAGQMDTVAPLVRGNLTERVHAYYVTDNFFQFLGVQPHLGRLLTTGDSHIAVLSYDYWQRAFAGESQVVGQSIRIKGHVYQIAGIAPQGFSGVTIDSGPDIWAPFTNIVDYSSRFQEIGDHNFILEIIGRLRPGATLAQAERETAAQFDAYWKQSAAESPQNYDPKDRAGFAMQSIANGRSPMREQSRTALVFVLAGAGLLLLMVCANIGGLMLSRAASRDRETAIRLAVGATRARIMRQWLAQSLLLSAIGGAAGILIAYGTLPLLARWLPPARGIGMDPAELRLLSLDVHLDLRVLAFSVALCATSALLSAVAPAWRSARRDLYNALRSTGGTPHRRFQSVLCGVQVALCTVLLVSTGLFARSLFHLRTADAGFDGDRIAIFTFDPAIARYDSPQTWAYQQRLLNEVRALPGVEIAALASRSLLRGIGLVFPVVFPGEHGSGVPNTSVNNVTPGYFDVLGIRLLSGRQFIDSDYAEEGKPEKVIVNEAFVRRFSTGRSPLGLQFGIGREFKKAAYEIIGVVNDTKYRSLREIPPPIVYAYSYGPANFPATFALHIRTRADPRSMIQPVQGLLRSLDPNMPAYQAGTFVDEEDRSLWQERTLAGLAACFGVFAAILAALGLYGILANFVASRRRDIGIRLALGARSRHVASLLATRILPILAVGVFAGTALSVVAGKWSEALLYGVEASDRWSIAASLLSLAAIAAVAALPPVLRALRVEPATTLRAD